MGAVLFLIKMYHIRRFSLLTLPLLHYSNTPLCQSAFASLGDNHRYVLYTDSIPFLNPLYHDLIESDNMIFNNP